MTAAKFETQMRAHQDELDALFATFVDAKNAFENKEAEIREFRRQWFERDMEDEQ